MDNLIIDVVCDKLSEFLRYGYCDDNALNVARIRYERAVLANKKSSETRDRLVSFLVDNGAESRVDEIYKKIETEKADKEEKK